MVRRIAWFAVPIALAPVSALAEDKDGLTIDGRLRVRVEAIDGQFRPGIDGTAALLLQTDIVADYKIDWFHIGGELEDARVYFERRHSSVSPTEVNAIEPVQAYLAADIGDAFKLKLGRQTMNFGSRRLVSRQNFRNTTNAFDGGRIDWTPAKDTSLSAFWTMPLNRRPTDLDALLDNDVELDKERDDFQFFGVFGSIGHVLGGVAEAYVYRLYERDAPDYLTRNRRLWTVGARLYRAPKKAVVDFELEGAWQGGETRATTTATDRNDLAVDAGLIHASAGYTFASKWSPRIAIAYDFASGDGTGGHYGRFDTLFGARVFEFGPTSFYGPISRANLSSPAIRAEAKPDARWDGYVAFRGLWLARATDSFAGTGVRDATGASGRYAGTQIDGRVRYWLKPKTVQLSVGGAIIAKGRFLNDAPNAPQTGDTHYGFAEVAYSF